ncbi:MAG: YggS family pyridoxal phosphate-dependent enzyme [Flavobacteriales bacterium]
MSVSDNILILHNSLPNNICLVAVSKTKPSNDILEAYNAGQRHFGENKVQELENKAKNLPTDIKWHMIGHLQTNKVKYIAPFVSLIHTVDSLKLLKEINKRAIQNDRVIDCLIQIKIAQEESKFGMSENEARNLLEFSISNVNIVGFMGMATFSNDTKVVKEEFKRLKTFFDKSKKKFPNLEIISMGMSSDYQIAIEEGSNMIRLGSSIFGRR